MVEIKEKDKKVFYQNIYPNWVKDDVDKLLHEVFMELQLEKKEGTTRAVIKNKVDDKIIFIYNKGLTIYQRIDKLLSEGVLDMYIKNKEIQLIKLKESKENKSLQS